MTTEMAKCGIHMRKIKLLAVIGMPVVLVLISAVVALAANGIISGRLMIDDDQPFADGIVLLYNADLGPPPAPERYRLIADHMAESDSRGVFRTKLPAGNYYLCAVKRINKQHTCHISEGDLLLFSLDEKGLQKIHRVTENEQLNLSVISGARPMTAVTAGTGITSIEGTIQDEAGNPIAGAAIVACMKPKCEGKQLFSAEPSKNDGTFSINVHQGGVFYLKVFGGSATSNDIKIANKETVFHTVTAVTGKTVDGQVIQVRSKDIKK